MNTAVLKRTGDGVSVGWDVSVFLNLHHGCYLPGPAGSIQLTLIWQVGQPYGKKESTLRRISFQIKFPLWIIVPLRRGQRLISGTTCWDDRGGFNLPEHWLCVCHGSASWTVFEVTHTCFYRQTWIFQPSCDRAAKWDGNALSIRNVIISCAWA